MITKRVKKEGLNHVNERKVWRPSIRRASIINLLQLCCMTVVGLFRQPPRNIIHSIITIVMVRVDDDDC